MSLTALEALNEPSKVIGLILVFRGKQIKSLIRADVNSIYVFFRDNSYVGLSLDFVMDVAKIK